MAWQTIEYSTDGAVGTLTLNRPDSLNAVSRLMNEELLAFWTERLTDTQTRVLILTGAGRGFCSGLDMKETMASTPPGGYSPERAYVEQRGFSEMILLMRRVPQPIVAAVNGAAAGAGFSFCLASDIRLAAPSAKFCAAYINIGVGGADMGASWLAPRIMGIGNAARYLLTGDKFDAAEAHRMGLVQAVCEPDDLMTEAKRIAQTMSQKSPLGLRLTKEALDQNTSGVTLEEAVRLEDRNQAMCIAQLTNPVKS